MFIKKNNIFFCKLFLITFSIFANKGIYFIQRTDIFLTKFFKDDHELEYINKFNEIKFNFSQDLFLYSFLKEISIISYDYTNQINKVNNKVHVLVNLNNKYIYPLIVSINSALINSNKNKTTLVYHVLCSNDLSKNNINRLKSLLNLYSNFVFLVNFSPRKDIK